MAVLFVRHLAAASISLTSGGDSTPCFCPSTTKEGTPAHESTALGSTPRSFRSCFIFMYLRSETSVPPTLRLRVSLSDFGSNPPWFTCDQPACEKKVLLSLFVWCFRASSCIMREVYLTVYLHYVYGVGQCVSALCMWGWTVGGCIICVEPAPQEYLAKMWQQVSPARQRVKQLR